MDKALGVKCGAPLREVRLVEREQTRLVTVEIGRIAGFHNEAGASLGTLRCAGMGHVDEHHADAMLLRIADEIVNRLPVKGLFIAGVRTSAIGTSWLGVQCRG